MMQELFHFTGGKGHCPILNTRNIEDWHYLEYGLIILEKGETHEGTLPDNREAFFNILEGELTIVTGDDEQIKQSLGTRQTVFEGNCCGFYLPRRSKYYITAHSHIEIAIVQAVTSEDSVASIVSPDSVIREKRGKKNRTRDCSLIDIPSTRLTVGEVHKPGGNWSGAPPHKHDYDDPFNETVQEELYFFRFAKPKGFGIQRLYDEDGNDRLFLVKNNDTIAIRRGYHEVVTGPGYDMWYFFALAGPRKELIPRFDADELWIDEE